MSKSSVKSAILNNKIATAQRHNKNYAYDLLSLADGVFETKKLIEANNNLIAVSNRELQALKDQEFLRYLRTPCYRYAA